MSENKNGRGGRHGTGVAQSRVELGVELHVSGTYVDPNPPLDDGLESAHLRVHGPGDSDPDEPTDLDEVIAADVNRGRPSMPPGCYHHRDNSYLLDDASL